MATSGITTEYPIYLGLWTDWSHGRVAGAIITLSHRNGAFLTAFLAIFVTTAGTSFWRIACFALHQFFSTRTAQDGLYHQRQAILRNAANESIGLRSLIRLLWAWRQRAHGPVKRVLPLLLLTLLTMVTFAGAGILSAKVGQMGNEVLISSPSCGRMDQSLPSMNDGDTLFTTVGPFIAERMTSYASYVQRCYSNSSNTMGSCGPFTTPRLPVTIDRNASCPFDEALCRTQDRNIQLETTINSHSDLGMNAPPQLQFETKIITHCAPIITEGHKESRNFSEETAYTRYFYGTRDGMNYTYEYAERSWDKIIFENWTTAYADYNVFSYIKYAMNHGEGNGEWYPIDGLFRPDGDTDMVFLSANNIIYTDEINDDWYSAHQTPNADFDVVSPGGDDSRGGVNYYMSDEPASVLGCKLQYQACKPGVSSQDGCSRLGGILDLANGYLASPEEQQILSWMWPYPWSVDDVITFLQISSLASRLNLEQGIQGQLPDDQWQIDVENWHNINLAHLQGRMIDQAAGPDDEGILNCCWKRPETDVESHFCKNQKIVSTAYSNFSLLWLLIILIIGGLIIMIDFSLVSIISWVEKRRKIFNYSRIEWLSDDLLQLQRLAHEELQFGTWHDCADTKAIPVTEKGELLAVLDTNDPSHPRLQRKPSLCGKEDTLLSPTDSATQTMSLGQVDPEKSKAFHIEILPNRRGADIFNDDHSCVQHHSNDEILTAEVKTSGQCEDCGS